MFDLGAEAAGSLAGSGALLFALVIGHMLGDFPLQGQFLALGKVRSYWTTAKAPPAGRGMWLYCLTAHSLIQAGIVWCITDHVGLALAELVLHWITDHGKGEGRIGFAIDQAAHLLAKVVFAVLFYLGWVG